MKAIIKWLLCLTATFCVGACFGLNTTATVADTGVANSIEATITEVNNESLDNGNSFVMVLSANDYMTASEWSDRDYKWLNAEGVQDFAGRSDIDLSANNVANAQLDQNLGEYNFEEYILIDGKPLSEFSQASQTNTYALIANKRTRPNTISIDFQPNVLSGIELIEIKAGCQLPTLAYSYLGTGEFSCIEVQEDAVYENRNGAWIKYFKGYEEGVEYEGSEDYLHCSFEATYKGHTAVPLNAYTDFFMKNAVQGEYLQGKAVVSAANTEKGNVMLLRFVNPIDAQEFSRLNLRVYINHQVDVLTYNADAITEEELGPALESFTVNGGQFSSLTLNSALYADDNGEISQIVFQFAEDCQPQYNANGEILYDQAGRIIRDTFHFVSFNVAKTTDNTLVSEDSFMLVDDGDQYALTFRFHKSGSSQNMTLDTSKVAVNDVLLSDVLAECSEATAEWYSAKGIYQINVSLPKSYTGAARIKNAEYGFAGNNMSVLKGLAFPNGDLLAKNYTCHLYAGERILDSELVQSYQAIEVENVLFSFIDSSQNLNFTIYFSGPITTSLYNHACEREDWRSDEETSKIINYDGGSSDIFVNGGYKASLLDKVVINGRTIGEWHAFDAAALTNVQVHYGVGLELNRMDIRFEAVSKNTYDQLYGLVSDGNGVTVEVLSGLKFMTNNATTKTQAFKMVNGEFKLQQEAGVIHVYYNGSEVQNGQEITVQTSVSDASIAVEGVEEYSVSRADVDGKKVYTIAYGNGLELTFTVVEDVVVVTKEEKDGCFAAVGANSVLAALAIGAALTIIAKRGKQYEEN